MARHAPHFAGGAKTAASAVDSCSVRQGKDLLTPEKMDKWVLVKTLHCFLSEVIRNDSDFHHPRAGR
jgi:hypothetical protein